jgi:hypothetical protein
MRTPGQLLNSKAQKTVALKYKRSEISSVENLANDFEEYTIPNEVDNKTRHCWEFKVQKHPWQTAKVKE